MDWFLVLALIVLGIGLIIIEILFVPGTTVVGIVGVLALCAGNYMAFSYFNTSVATIVLVGSIVGGAVATVVSFKSGTWKKFSLKTVNTAKVNEGPGTKLQVEQRGKTLSALRPFGKAEFDGQIYEVRTSGNYVKPGENVKILFFEGPKIYVEPIND